MGVLLRGFEVAQAQYILQNTQSAPLVHDRERCAMRKSLEGIVVRRAAGRGGRALGRTTRAAVVIRAALAVFGARGLFARPIRLFCCTEIMILALSAPQLQGKGPGCASCGWEASSGIIFTYDAAKTIDDAVDGAHASHCSTSSLPSGAWNRSTRAGLNSPWVPAMLWLLPHSRLVIVAIC